MNTIIRTLGKFEAAHRIIKDEGKYKFLHGHNFLVEMVISGEPRENGYVEDFERLKKLCDTYDHVVLLEFGDPLAQKLINARQKVLQLTNTPTCEGLAEIFYNAIKAFNQENSVRITLWENQESCAIVGNV